MNKNHKQNHCLYQRIKTRLANNPPPPVPDWAIPQLNENLAEMSDPNFLVAAPNHNAHMLTVHLQQPKYYPFNDESEPIGFIIPPGTILNKSLAKWFLVTKNDQVPEPFDDDESITKFLYNRFHVQLRDTQRIQNVKTRAAILQNSIPDKGLFVHFRNDALKIFIADLYFDGHHLERFHIINPGLIACGSEPATILQQDKTFDLINTPDWRVFDGKVIPDHRNYTFVGNLNPMNTTTTIRTVQNSDKINCNKDAKNWLSQHLINTYKSHQKPGHHSN